MTPDTANRIRRSHAFGVAAGLVVTTGALLYAESTRGGTILTLCVAAGFAFMRLVHRIDVAVRERQQRAYDDRRAA